MQQVAGFPVVFDGKCGAPLGQIGGTVAAALGGALLHGNEGFSRVGFELAGDAVQDGAKLRRVRKPEQRAI